MNLVELQSKGWTLVEGVSSAADLLELGNSIGRPVPAPNGEIIKEIRPLEISAARKGTQSSMYGTGPFPFHTDTAFLPLPVRFVILRVCGDVRRPTTVTAFEDLLSDGGPKVSGFVNRAVWVVRAGAKAIYCSSSFRSGNSTGMRYDADVMTPANLAAQEVDSVLRPLVKSKGEPIRWTGTLAAIICNWTCLHGRGPAPPEEGERILQRLYVR